MYAECAARGAADQAKGQQYLDAVRTRAGVGSISLTLDNIIDERGRELYYEGMRRQDLIRFGLFTTDDYLWEFKGGVQQGQAVDDHNEKFCLPVLITLYPSAGFQGHVHQRGRKTPELSGRL